MPKKSKTKRRSPISPKLGASWIKRIEKNLGPRYRIRESDNFQLLSDESDKYVAALLKFLERALKRIALELNGIAKQKANAKHTIVIFGNLDQYYSYIGNFYPRKGKFGLSSGMFINQRGGHFVFSHQELSRAEPIAAHELTHACLAHLPIPLWLNEGIAVAMEDIIAGSYPLRMDSEMLARHKAFWGKAEIQQFWSGASFGRSDEGQELSYHLARFAVRALSHDYASFREFVLSAHHFDGGEAAARKTFGGSLQGLIEQILGPGDWKPKPRRRLRKKAVLLRRNEFTVRISESKQITNNQGA